MATHRITGEFVAVMEHMDGSPIESAEVLVNLMYERFGYLRGFEVWIVDGGAEEIRSDADEADDAAWAQADADYDAMQEAN